MLYLRQVRIFLKYVNARMAKLVNVAVSEAVGVQSLRVRVSLRARRNLKACKTMFCRLLLFIKYALK